MDLSTHPHKRFNPLTGEWVLVSPHRTKRPWQGKVEALAANDKPQYDPKCYLCPGNERAGGLNNPSYSGTYVFDNDFAALLTDTPEANVNENDLFVAQTERGICKVICFSPRHDLTLALMDTDAIKGVVNCWIEQYLEIGSHSDINYVQIFENRGDVMGCSNPHPHGQIWSNTTVPYLPSLEQQHQKSYLDKRGSCLLCDYLKAEIVKEERVVIANDSFVALVPFWAVWPYEIMILPRKHHAAITTLNEKEKQDLADILRRMCIRFDNLFSTFFPYSMGIHQSPTDGSAHEEWHFHFHFYPPLLRSATVKKFMVGYEMLASPQRDITAELSAEKLRACSEIHFLTKN